MRVLYLQSITTAYLELGLEFYGFGFGFGFGLDVAIECRSSPSPSYYILLQAVEQLDDVLQLVHLALVAALDR